MVDLVTVRRFPRFAGLSPDAHAWLSERFRRKSLARGEILFREGEEATRLCLIERGAVKVFRSLESGRELIVGIFRHGDAVGEVALIDGGGYPASAAAHEDASVLLMPRADYLFYLRRFDGAAMALLRDLMLRMRTMQRRVEQLGGGGVEYRLARVLQSLCAAAGSVADGPAEGRLTVPIALTRQHLADMVGARVETVIRIMSRWQREGLVGSDEHGLWVRDRATLEALARVD